jgi:hypothetical protein
MDFTELFDRVDAMDHDSWQENWDAIGSNKDLISAIGNRLEQALEPEFTGLTLNRTEALAVSMLIGKIVHGGSDFAPALSQLLFDQY